MIYIHKGDDTNFENEQFLTFNIQSNYDMSNWMCIIQLCGIVKTVKDLSSGTFQINYSNQDTKAMLAGTYYFNIKVVDGEGRIKTISNSVPVEITNKIVENKEQIISLEALPINDTQINIVVSGGGGGGGTTNHALLFNLGYEQSGHTGFASSQDIIGLQTQINNNSEFIQQATDEFTAIQEQLDNKQPIGNYALKTELPTQTSQLENNSGFITNAVNDLINYYQKNEVYNKTEINNLIDSFTSLKIEIVEQLPTENISTSTFYLIERQGQEQNNVYDEYLYINDSWELIGNTAIDLTDYALKSEIPTQTSQLTNDSDFATNSSVDTKLQTKQDNLIAGENITIENNVISSTGGGGQSGDFIAGGTILTVGSSSSADFATLNEAYSFLTNKISDGQIKIQFEDGTYTYTEVCSVPACNIGRLTIQGNASDPSKVKIVNNSSYFILHTPSSTYPVWYQNLTIEKKGASGSCISCGRNTQAIYVKNCNFISDGTGNGVECSMGICTVGGSLSFDNINIAVISACGQVNTDYGTSITYTKTYSGNGYIFSCVNGGFMQLQGVTTSTSGASITKTSPTINTFQTASVQNGLIIGTIS